MPKSKSSSSSARSRTRSRSSSSSSSSSASSSSPSSSSSSSSRSSSSSSRSSRSRSRSHSPARNSDPRRSPSPAKVHVSRLTKNVNKQHITEIFKSYGEIKSVDLPYDRWHPHLSRGSAYVEFERTEDADRAIKYMDGGQIDGQEISVAKVRSKPALVNSGGRKERPSWRRR